jgi:hypothetical protein
MEDDEDIVVDAENDGVMSRPSSESEEASERAIEEARKRDGTLTCELFLGIPEINGSVE